MSNDLISSNDERNSCFTLCQTFQGEGHFTDTPAIFIRLQGCHVGRSGETLNTLERKNEQQQKLLAVIRIQGYQTSQVVITRGEPYLYDLKPLTQLLEQKGYFPN